MNFGEPGTLRRLGTDYLDLYIIDRFDYETPVEETMSLLMIWLYREINSNLSANECFTYAIQSVSCGPSEPSYMADLYLA
ncbi:aldo/keto reductase [Pediococcus pentosaceus]|nr:aldo/keto reductase [Pediococcus pentosaceus]